MNDPRRPGGQRITSRFLTAYAVTFLVVIAVLGGVLDSSIRQVFVADLTDRLADEARLIQAGLHASDDPAELVEAMAAGTGLRITLVGADGALIADSEAAAPGESLADRPEVAAALAGELGVATRQGGSGDELLRYVAVPADGGVVVRVGTPMARIDDRLSEVRTAIVGGVVVAGAVGIVVVALIARLLARPILQVTGTAEAVAGGRLDVRAGRSSVLELDRLGQAVNRMAQELGARVLAAEQDRHTLRVVLDGLEQGVALIGEDDAVGVTNRAFRQLLGGEVSSLRELVPPSLQALVREAREGGEPVGTELEVGREGRWVRAVARPFSSDRRVLLTAVDVTEQRRVEAMRRDFVADASHELKTPVAAILASAQTLRMALERNPADAERFLDRLEASAEQLARMVSDLLDLSRLEGGETPRDLVQLGEVVGEETDRFAARARERGIQWSVVTEPVEVVGSAADLGLAVRNLCDNALRYTDSGGSVTVTLRREDGWAVLEVADTGVGIPTRALPRVFERFYRVDLARSRATGGTGLGLAIVKHVAERHGGSVGVESELGRGSVFRVRLPLGG